MISGIKKHGFRFCKAGARQIYSLKAGHVGVLLFVARECLSDVGVSLCPVVAISCECREIAGVRIVILELMRTDGCEMTSLWSDQSQIMPGTV